MTFIEKVSNDLKEAMKNKDEVKVSSLRLIRADILKKQKDKPGGNLTEEDIYNVLKIIVNRHIESIEEFKKGKRDDLVAKEEAQLEIAQSYLKIIESMIPEKISEEELKTIITQVINEVGALSSKDFGKVMGKVMPRLKETGKTIDGKIVNELVKSTLSAMEKA